MLKRAGSRCDQQETVLTAIRPFLLAALVLIPGAAHAADLPPIDQTEPGQVSEPPAASPWSARISAGAGFAPDYEGSDEYAIVPAFGGSFNYGNRYLSLEGFDLKANVWDSSSINFGPVVSYQLGRKDVEDAIVKRMKDIDDSVSIGGFASYSLAGLLNGNDSVTFGVQALDDVSGVSDGFVGTASIGYATPLSDPFFASLTATTSLASKDYARTYFGVSAADNAASGLATFAPEAGIKDVGIAATLTYAVTERGRLRRSAA
jgi:outer membrane protein